MARARSNIETIRQRLADIEAWQAEGVSQREISRRLGMSESSFRTAIKHAMPTQIDVGRPIPGANRYEAVALPQPEAIRVVLEETNSLLPALREMAEQWPTVQAMLREWTERQQLLQVSPAYQPYDGFYSCRLNKRLIEDLKTYAVEHRLSQSQLVTLALQAYMGHR